MKVNRIQQNNNPSFNARLKIKDIHGVLEKTDIDLLRSEAAKFGTKKDFIKVELGVYEPGDTKTWAEQGLGWMTEREMDSVDINLKSIINKKTETDEFSCYGHGYEEVAEDIVNRLMTRFEEFADKLKK